MAEDEMTFMRDAEKFLIEGLIEQAKALLVCGLKIYPESIVLKDLLQQYQDIKIFNTLNSTQQENEELKQNKLQNERELDQITCKIKKDIKEIKQQEKVNENDSFQMRIKTLITELNELIENENDTWKKIRTIETCIGIVYTALDLKNFEKAECELLKAESLSTGLMKKINKANDSEIDQNVKAAINKKNMKEKRKEQTEKEETECKNAGECLYKFIKAREAGDFVTAEQILLQAKSYDPMLNLELEMLTIKARLASESSEENKNLYKTVPEETAIGNDVKFAAEYLYNAKKSLGIGDFIEAERNLLSAKLFDLSLDLEPYLSKCRAKITSRSLTKGNTLIPKKVQDTVATYTKEDMEDKTQKEEVKKDFKNFKKSNFCSTCKAGLKTTKSQSKEEEVKTLKCMAEKAINDKNLENAINLLNSAEELHPTDQAKELINSVNNIQIARNDTFIHSNCYEFPSEANESDKAEALKCITLAQAAFQEGRNEKAERLLLKSLRIWDTQKAKSYLEDVRNAITQNTTEVKTEKSYNSLNERLNDYSNCLDLAEKAIVGGELAKAEHLLLKAIRINPNDGAKEQLENIRRVKLSQSSSNKVREVAKMFLDLGLEARTSKKFNLAYIYFDYAYKKQPNECTLDLLRDAQKERDISNGRHSPSSSEFFFEANRLLDKAENFIRNGDLEKAESFIIVSWDVKKTRRTTRVHKKFLQARLNLFNGDKEHERGERYNEKSEKIFESDQLVMLALDRYKNNKQFKETEELLMRAAELNPSDRIEKLLYEIRDAKNNEPEVPKKIYNYYSHLFFE